MSALKHTLAVAFVVITMFIAMPGCSTLPPSSSAPTSSTDEPSTMLPGTYPMDILYVREIPQTTNPAGPLVEVALRNSSSEPIISLFVAFRKPGHPDFTYDFRVNDLNPMLPGQTIKISRVLFGLTSNEWSLYSLDISGTFQDGKPFALLMIS